MQANFVHRELNPEDLGGGQRALLIAMVDRHALAVTPNWRLVGVPASGVIADGLLGALVGAGLADTGITDNRCHCTLTADGRAMARRCAAAARRP